MTSPAEVSSATRAPHNIGPRAYAREFPSRSPGGVTDGRPSLESASAASRAPAGRSYIALARALARALLGHLRARPQLRVWRVKYFTTPTSDAASVEHAMVGFCARLDALSCGRWPGAGSVLVRDCSAAGRHHAHGVVIAAADITPAHLAALWCRAAAPRKSPDRPARDAQGVAPLAARRAALVAVLVHALDPAHHPDNPHAPALRREGLAARVCVGGALRPVWSALATASDPSSTAPAPGRSGGDKSTTSRPPHPRGTITPGRACGWCATGFARRSKRNRRWCRRPKGCQPVASRALLDAIAVHGDALGPLVAELEARGALRRPAIAWAAAHLSLARYVQWCDCDELFCPVCAPTTPLARVPVPRRVRSAPQTRKLVMEGTGT